MKVQQHDGSIIEMEKSDKASYDVLNHSTSHLLAWAIQELYPKCDVTVQYGGQPIYYYFIALE
jgi:threonyl-tRNA synthetase